MNLKNANKTSPISVVVLNITGIYLIAIFILCIILNSILICVFMQKNKLKSSINFLIFLLTIFNLIGSTAFPMVIHSHFYRRWIFSQIGCIISGYVIYFVGCLQIYLMAAISLIRYDILKNPRGKKTIQKKHTIQAVVISILLSLFWSTTPLLGWSYYSLEESLVTCSVEWKEKNSNVISYNIAMFVFVFIVPFSLIILTNIRSIQILQFRRKNSPHIENLKLIDAEKKITFSLMIYIAGFLLTWSPYTFVSIYTSLIDPNESMPNASNLSAVFAKSSVVWSTLLYFITNRNLKTSVKGSFNIIRSTNQVDSKF